MVKVYSVIGFPWETDSELKKCDLVSACKEVDSKLKNEIIMKFQLSHFIPRQKTPMWNSEFNFNDYRKESDKIKIFYDGEKIKLFAGMYNSSPAYAAQETIWQRSFYEDADILRIIAKKKFQSLSTYQKTRIFKNELSKFFNVQERETIKNIETCFSY